MNKKQKLIIGAAICGVLLVVAIYLNWPSSPPPVDQQALTEFETDAQENPRPAPPIPVVDPSLPPPRTTKGAR